MKLLSVLAYIATVCAQKTGIAGNLSTQISLPPLNYRNSSSSSPSSSPSPSPSFSSSSSPSQTSTPSPSVSTTYGAINDISQTSSPSVSTLYMISPSYSPTPTPTPTPVPLFPVSNSSTVSSSVSPFGYQSPSKTTTTGPLGTTTPTSTPSFALEGTLIAFTVIGAAVIAGYVFGRVHEIKQRRVLGNIPERTHIVVNPVNTFQSYRMNSVV